jgi:hypothetical protein
MADTYMAMNGPSPTAAAQVPVTTGTAIKTMLQIATPSTRTIKVVQWWVEFDGSAAATPIRVELLDSSFAATITALVAADITKWSDPNAPTSLITIGSTTASGYTASAEGTPGTIRMLESHFVPPTGGLLIQYPLGREPEVPVSRFLRIRVTAAAAVNAYCGIVWEE